MNSGLNLSPVRYSVENTSYLSRAQDKAGHTESVLVRKRWNHACRKIFDEILPQEDKVLEASASRGGRGGINGQVRLHANETV